MWVLNIPLGELSKAASSTPARIAPLSKGQGWLGKASNPGVCFCSLMLIRFCMTALSFVLLLVELPTLRENVFKFSQCRRVYCRRYSPQDSDAPEKTRGKDIGLTQERRVSVRS